MNQLKKTKFKTYAILLALVLGLNLTLSLSSLTIKHESRVAACMLMVVGLVLCSTLLDDALLLWISVLGVGTFSALATFTRSRWILTTAIFALAWVVLKNGKRNKAFILIGVLGVMLRALVTLAIRSNAARNGAVVFTNLSAAIRLGTGTKTSGGYADTGSNSTCKPNSNWSALSETHMNMCYSNWYVTNPIDSLRLYFKKTVYFWSPWSRPASNGTMARNPWLKIDPIVEIDKQGQQGNNLVYETLEKIISWIWLWSGILFLFIGFYWLVVSGGRERKLKYFLFHPVLASWLASVAMIGDHRFRIPTMSLSLVLQIFGMYALKRKFKKL